MNKLHWNLKRNSYIFIQENVFENVIWKTAAILSRPQCVKRLNTVDKTPTTFWVQTIPLYLYNNFEILKKSSNWTEWQQELSIQKSLSLIYYKSCLNTSVTDWKQSSDFNSMVPLLSRFYSRLNFAFSWIQYRHNEIYNNNCVNFWEFRSPCILFH